MQKHASTAFPAAATNTSSLEQSMQSAATNSTAKSNVGQHAAPGSHFAQAASTPVRASVASPAPALLSANATMIYDPNSRTFMAAPRTVQSAASKAPEPLPHPMSVPMAAALAPGSYDPATRSLVPASKSTPVTAEDDSSWEPPPRNPARITPPPSSPRAVGVLKKHPSMVREDREGEQEAEAASPATTEKTSRTIQTSAGPAKAYSTPGGFHNRSSSLDVPARTPDGKGRGRVTSLSPQRSAHFSQSPIVQATRHEPPARDLSPVKSAMKHSPASSVRAPSPMTNFSPNGHKVASSDASDTTSLHSQDGTSLVIKKKKNRVSFDEQPREVETSTPSKLSMSSALDDENDMIMTPRPILPSFGSVRNSRSPETAEENTKIRSERQEASSDHAVGGILMNHTNGHAVKPFQGLVTTSKEPGDDIVGENDDHSEPPGTSMSVAATTAQLKTNDSATEAAQSFVPTSQNTDEDGEVPAINLLPPTPGIDEQSKVLGEEGASDTKTIKRPNSMIGFVVPGGWEDNSEEQSVASPPVTSTPQIHDAPAHEPSPILDAIDEDTDDAFSDAAEDLSELDDGGFASLNAIAASPIVTKTSSNSRKETVPASPSLSPDSPLKMPTDRTVTSGHKSQTSGDWREATAYWSKLSRQQRQQIERSHFSSDDEAEPIIALQPKKKRSNLKQTEFLAASTGAALKPAAPKQSGMKKSLRGTAGSPVGQASNSSDTDVHLRRSMRSGPSGLSGAMPTSMRDGSAGQRKPQSAQVQTNGALQKSNSRPMSASSLPSTTAGSTMRASSPLAQQAAFPNVAPKAQPRPPQRPTSTAPSNSYTAKVQEKYANDSDSESSFKKARRRQTGASTMETHNKANMKRSMRAGSVDSSTRAYASRPTSPTPASKGKAFSIRSLSPTGSLFGRRKQESIRETLRGGPAETAPKRTTLRNNAPAPRSRLGSNASSRPVPVPAAPVSRFKSRFADSDDEDEDDRGKRGGFFNSRFAESDDDDGPKSPAMVAANLKPVRGIPRRRGQTDGDSTDLEDEEDVGDPRKASRRRAKQTKPMVPDPTDVEKAMEAARRNLGLPPVESKPPALHDTEQGSTLANGSATEPTFFADKPEPKSRPEDVQINGAAKKRGFMGSILRRNRGSTQSVMQVMPSSPKPPGTPSSTTSAIPIGGSPVVDRTPIQAAPSTPSSPMANKLVRRNSNQPKPRPTRGNSWMSTATAPAGLSGSPSTMPTQAEIDAWPLPAPPPGVKTLNFGAADRPNTADGVDAASNKRAQSMRPDIGHRTQSGTPLRGAVSGSRSVRINAGPGIDEESVIGDSVDGEGRRVYSVRTGKKKKFPLLRRAFGLND